MAGLIIFQFTVGSSAQVILDSSDRAAYERAVSALTTFRKTGALGDTEVQLAKSLAFLSQSNSRLSDQFLAQLGLFSMDGAVGEEFSCAASKRGKNLSLLLRRQLENFNISNACEQTAIKEGIPKEALCMTRSEFARLASDYRRLPLKDVEGACSH